VKFNHLHLDDRMKYCCQLLVMLIRGKYRVRIRCRCIGNLFRGIRELDNQFGSGVIKVR